MDNHFHNGKLTISRIDTDEISNKLIKINEIINQSHLI